MKNLFLVLTISAVVSFSIGIGLVDTLSEFQQSLNKSSILIACIMSAVVNAFIFTSPLTGFVYSTKKRVCAIICILFPLIAVGIELVGKL